MALAQVGRYQAIVYASGPNTAKKEAEGVGKGGISEELNKMAETIQNGLTVYTTLKNGDSDKPVIA